MPTKSDLNSRLDGIPWCWGATDEEIDADYPCAGRIPAPVLTLYRAVDVAASAQAVFRWVCQLKVAPYSYDLLDNLGRRSSRTLTPGAEDLAIGQRMMVFRLVDFEPGVHITGEAFPGPRQIFGPLAGTYRVQPRTDTASRLVVRLDIGMPNRFRRLAATPLAWGDLFMMRKQLLTIKQLAEHNQR